MVSKSTFLTDSWEAFYDRLKSQVTSVTTDVSDTFTIQTYTSSFPDKTIDDKSSYPILIVNPVNSSDEYFTLKRSYFDATIQIEIYTTNSEAADLFMDVIINAIETNRTTFRSTNSIYMIKQNNTDSDAVMREGFKIHVRRVTFSFRYYFVKTTP